MQHSRSAYSTHVPQGGNNNNSYYIKLVTAEELGIGSDERLVCLELKQRKCCTWTTSWNSVSTLRRPVRLKQVCLLHKLSQSFQRNSQSSAPSCCNQGHQHHHLPEATKQPVIRSVVLQPVPSTSSSTGSNKRRLELDDDYAKLLKCEIERVQVEKRKLELECRVLELKQTLLQHKVDDIQK